MFVERRGQGPADIVKRKETEQNRISNGKSANEPDENRNDNSKTKTNKNKD